MHERRVPHTPHLPSTILQALNRRRRALLQHPHAVCRGERQIPDPRRGQDRADVARARPHRLPALQIRLRQRREHVRHRSRARRRQRVLRDADPARVLCGERECLGDKRRRREVEERVREDDGVVHVRLWELSEMRDGVDLEEGDARAYSGRFEVRLRVAQRRRRSCSRTTINNRFIICYLSENKKHSARTVIEVCRINRRDMAALTDGSRENRRAIALATADLEHRLAVADVPELRERDAVLRLVRRDSQVPWLCVPVCEESGDSVS